MSYDPTTDPHWLGEAPVDSTDQVTALEEELSGIAQMLETFAGGGWAVIEAALLRAQETARADLSIYRPNRDMAAIAYVQGQLSEIEHLLSLPESTRDQYDEKSVELAELLNPALA